MKPAMNDLLEMLTTITRWKPAGAGSSRDGRKGSRKPSGSPFDSESKARKWMKSLPGETPYETHHALVEGLERFNAEHVDVDVERLKVLLAIEETGLPLQSPIIQQYMRSHASFPLARQSLWRETWAFWSLLAAAWFKMLKHAYKGPARDELQPWRAEIAARALRYVGLAMRWSYHNSQPPSAAAWQRVHNIYRMAERDGYVTATVTLNDRQTTCAREYALAVLIEMMNPLDYESREIEEIARQLECLPDLPLPESNFVSARHTHAVDLAASEGAFVLDEEQPAGAQLRFFDLTPLVAHLESLEPLAGTETEQGLYRQIANLILSDDVRRSSRRVHRFGQVWVASGMGNILAALACHQGGRPRQAMDAWMLRDESTDGMGFSLDASAALPHGRLIAVSRNPSANGWELLAIRWNQKTEQNLLVGAQRLSRHPKRVEFVLAQNSAGAPSAPTYAVVLPLSDTDGNASHLLLPQTCYQPGAQVSLRDGSTILCVRLGDVCENHERWVRVGMDVLSREQISAAA
jgi:hypothetical protein